MHKYVKMDPEDKTFIYDFKSQLIPYKEAVAESFQNSGVIHTTKQIYEWLENFIQKVSN